jgi:hypothetical protein
MTEPPRVQRERDEKDEKGQNQGWDEKWRRDPVDAAMWAVLLIWAGFMVLAYNFGWFSQYERFPAWSIGLIGAGIIVLLTAFFRLLMPAYRRPMIGNIVFGAILLGIGLGEAISWVIIAPLILIGIGLAILLTGLLRRR